MTPISVDEWPNTDPTGDEKTPGFLAPLAISDEAALDGTARGAYMLCRGGQYKVYAEPKLD
jgi:hypothetical protein